MLPASLESQRITAAEIFLKRDELLSPPRGFVFNPHRFHEFNSKQFLPASAVEEFLEQIGYNKHEEERLKIRKEVDRIVSEAMKKKEALK